MGKSWLCTFSLFQQLQVAGYLCAGWGWGRGAGTMAAAAAGIFGQMGRKGGWGRGRSRVELELSPCGCGGPRVEPTVSDGGEKRKGAPS